MILNAGIFILKSIIAVLNKDEGGLRAQILCWLFMIYTLMSAHLIGRYFIAYFLCYTLQPT